VEKLPKRIVVFQPLEVVNGSSFSKRNKEIIAFDDPFTAMKAVKYPAEIVVGIVSLENKNIQSKAGAIYIRTPKDVKEVARIPLTAMEDEKSLSDYLHAAIPEGLSITKKRVDGPSINNIVSKNKRNKKKKLHSPLRDHLDYGVKQEKESS